MKKRQTFFKQDGQILIFTLVIMVIVSIMIAGLVGYTGVQIKSHRQAVNRTVGLDIAEAGAELAVWKLNNQPGYTGEINTAYGNGTYTVTVSSEGPTTKLVKVDSYVPNSTNPISHRIVQLTAVVGTTNIGFNYGVQAGAGGIKMDNNSTVNGNIYSNGNIIGDNNGVKIAGTAISAGATGKIDEVDDIDGNAVAHFIEDTSIDGNANAYSFLRSDADGNVDATTISNCTVGGTAIYDTRVSCTVTGTATTPNPTNFTDPAVEPLPITDEQIAEWEADAASGGTVGTQTIDGITTSLGPKKIVGNLVLTNNSVLTVTGTIWVTGNITLSNGTTLKLDPTYGALSGSVIAGLPGDTSAGFIDAENGAIINGSGTSGSYIMLLSERNNVSTTAIRVSNNASGAMFYAGHGVIEVSNNARGKELTGYKIHLNQGAVITYESGLANSQFTSGPGGGWEIQPQSWQLLR
jgi:hypothetical protein